MHVVVTVLAVTVLAAQLVLLVLLPVLRTAHEEDLRRWQRRASVGAPRPR